MLFAISVLWYISLILYQFGELLKLLWGQWIFECMYINRFWFNPIINYLYCRYYCGFVDQKKLDLFVPNICLSKHKMFHHLKNGVNPVLFSRTKGKLFRIRLNLILKFISNNCFFVSWPHFTRREILWYSRNRRQLWTRQESCKFHMVCQAPQARFHWCQIFSKIHQTRRIPGSCGFLNLQQWCFLHHQLSLH